jgi:hypothetical protein
MAGDPYLGQDRSNDEGLSSVGVIAVVASLALVLVLTLMSTGAFTSSGPKEAGTTSVLSNSGSEQQLKLCVEGRHSSYGDPPSMAQQAACTRTLEGQLAGAAGQSAPRVPSDGSSTTVDFPAVPQN